MDFNVDFQALMEQMKNQAMLTIIATMVPDEKLKTQMLDIMNIFIRHGISVDEAFQITMEIAEVLKPDTEEKETDNNEI